MNTVSRISDSEMEIMCILWANDGAMTLPEILAALPKENQWKYNTVATFLTRLCEKKILSCRKSGRVNAFVTEVSEKEYRDFETREFLRKVHGNSVSSLIASLFDEKLRPEQISELMERLERE